MPIVRWGDLYYSLQRDLEQKGVEVCGAMLRKDLQNILSVLYEWYYNHNTC